MTFSTLELNPNVNLWENLHKFDHFLQSDMSFTNSNENISSIDPMVNTHVENDSINQTECNLIVSKWLRKQNTRYINIIKDEFDNDEESFEWRSNDDESSFEENSGVVINIEKWYDNEIFDSEVKLKRKKER